MTRLAVLIQGSRLLVVFALGLGATIRPLRLGIAVRRLRSRSQPPVARGARAGVAA